MSSLSDRNQRRLLRMARAVEQKLFRLIEELADAEVGKGDESVFWKETRQDVKLIVHAVRLMSEVAEQTEMEVFYADKPE